MSLINKSEHMIEINEYEVVHITGDIDNYSFELALYSEAFGLWLSQDKALLENMRPAKYEDLVERVEKFLIKKAA